MLGCFALPCVPWGIIYGKEVGKDLLDYLSPDNPLPTQPDIKTNPLTPTPTREPKIAPTPLSRTASNY